MFIISAADTIHLWCIGIGCSRIDRNQCPYGVVRDVLDCCELCGKGPGEYCGGFGRCGIGLDCVKVYDPVYTMEFIWWCVWASTVQVHVMHYYYYTCTCIISWTKSLEKIEQWILLPYFAIGSTPNNTTDFYYVSEALNLTTPTECTKHWWNPSRKGTCTAVVSPSAPICSSTIALISSVILACRC